MPLPPLHLQPPSGDMKETAAPKRERRRKPSVRARAPSYRGAPLFQGVEKRSPRGDGLLSPNDEEERTSPRGARRRSASPSRPLTPVSPRRQSPRREDSPAQSPAPSPRLGGKEVVPRSPSPSLLRRSSFQEDEGRHIDESEIELHAETLGHGGQATVYSGIWQPVNPALPPVSVAVKLFHHIHTGQAEAEVVEGEVAALAPLRHRNVLRVYGTTRMQGHIGVVMELCERGSLDALIFGSRSGHVLPVPALGTPTGAVVDIRRRLDIVLQVAVGLAYLHEQAGYPTLHLDLKPLNVLLSITDEGPVMKLADFGMSRVLGTLGSHVSTANAQGTPVYMAPEYVELNEKGHIHLDHKTDIYALGVLLFEVISGRRAWASRHANPWAIPGLAQRGIRPRIPKDGTVPNSVEALIRRCWANDRSVRPTAEEVVFELRLVNRELAMGGLGGSEGSIVAAAKSPPPVHTPQQTSPAQHEARKSPEATHVGSAVIGVGAVAGAIAESSVPINRRLP